MRRTTAWKQCFPWRLLCDRPPRPARRSYSLARGVNRRRAGSRLKGAVGALADVAVGLDLVALERRGRPTAADEAALVCVLGIGAAQIGVDAVGGALVGDAVSIPRQGRAAKHTRLLERASESGFDPRSRRDQIFGVARLHDDLDHGAAAVEARIRPDEHVGPPLTGLGEHGGDLALACLVRPPP